MPIEILMPRLSDTMEEGKILKWLKQVGDQIEVGDIIAEVETDKADMEMEALDAGALAKIQVQEGESAPVGAVIAVLNVDGAGVAPSEPEEAEADEPPASGETDREQEAATKRPSTKENDRSSRAPEEAEVRSKPATTTSPTPLETSVER
ncbi:MAG: biotin/lipoyl-containing protein, partial [Candidatus Binatia bacterium]